MTDSSHRIPYPVYGIAFLLFLWRFGYAYASGDQDELIPFLTHLLDGSLLGEDWFVQTQVEDFSVRTYFVWILRLLCMLMPLPVVVTGLYLILWLCIADGVYRLAFLCSHNQLASAASLVITLAVFHKWTLGANDLVYTMLVPEMLSWALALPAIRLFLHRRWILSACLLGLSAWFQLLVGLLTAGVLWMIQVWSWLGDHKRDHARAALTFGITFLISALPILIPIGLQQLQAGTVPDKPDVFYIVGPFRNPFHYMFFSFGPRAVVRFGLMVVLAMVSFVWLRRKQRVFHPNFIRRGFFVIAGICVIGFLATEMVPVLFIAKFQVFKLTVWVKLIMVVLICTAGVTLLPDRLQGFLSALIKRAWPGWAVVGLMTGLTLIGWIQDAPILTRRIQPLVHQQSALGQVEHWVRDHTPKDGIFAIPPSMSTFRSNAQRAVVVTYAAYPYKDEYMQAWYRRILDLAPIDPPHRGMGLKPILDAAYHTHNETAWLALRDRYNLDYLLIDTTQQTWPLSFETVYTQPPWTVYRLPIAP